MAPSGRPPQRPIKRILIANRGEIAIRILQACRELPDIPVTYAIYTASDSTHVSLGQPDHALQIPSPSTYMDISFLIELVKKHSIDAVHPGYGFLSESAEFSRRMWEEANCMVVGPGWEVLGKTGDKLKAKQLAAECDVPLLQSMSSPSSSTNDVESFAQRIGLPLMIKAVDGGGGRGIRLVKKRDDLRNAVERCIAESPSRQVFAEQAAVDGFKHIEVQIIGDGNGQAEHIWERDCSVQRRFQKIVEVAPTPHGDRSVVDKVCAAAVRMAKQVKHLGLGTFEFLVNMKKGQYFFLEVNPRLQVEHTITESISGLDLVKEQLMLAQGLCEIDQVKNRNAGVSSGEFGPFSIQLRLCAEDPDANFALSIGKVASAQFPTGNGVRVDSHLSHGGVVGSDFDNLMAKIIVTSSTWETTVAKARRALDDTWVDGVKTNLNLLRAIISDPIFQSGQADTQWLEQNVQRLVKAGNQMGSACDKRRRNLPTLETTATRGSNKTNTTTSLRKGDAWSLDLKPLASKETSTSAAHHLRIDKIARNEFPEALVAEVSYTLPGQQPQTYKLALESTSTSADATSSTHRRGDANNKSHIVLPMSGKLIEVLVDEGDEVHENQVVAFVKQMKMELEIRSPRAGIAKWVIELENEDGDDAAEGVLVVELEAEESAKSQVRSRL